MKSFYFDDSLAENELHYKLKKYLDDNPLGDDYEELIIKCDNEQQYNSVLDALYHYTGDKIRIFATSHDDTEIIVEKDPRIDYRQFDEKNLMTERKDFTVDGG